MKYRLKKDLPFAKAGTEIWVDNLWDGWIDAKVYAPTLMTNEYRWEKIMLGKISALEAEGWIEEVKPREFWVELKQDSYGNWKVNDVSENKDWLHEENTLYKSIKVREVIE